MCFLTSAWLLSLISFIQNFISEQLKQTEGETTPVTDFDRFLFLLMDFRSGRWFLCDVVVLSHFSSQDK